MIGLGSRHIALAKAWLPTLSAYGATGTVGFLYFLDWEAVNRWIPFYNTKFVQSEPENA